MAQFHREPVAAQVRMGHETRVMTLQPDTEIRRKRLLWRATHRGIKEMDLILGGFVALNLDVFSDTEIADLERIMDIPDQDMLSWATKQGEVPPQHASPLLMRILAYTP
ncbi:MAG: succinate dehydrogenase assembly factor 2 [Alphaproteobacteria bacterium]|uniref:succinate dehydrogenase assembly factor 2 n=1 Tax=Aestuariivirga sp. TaxID=2650926 RepID=UPI0030189EE5|nr:succinate dehydrogenase assembly factor 2 [Alphaproteobacteria bacterium]